MEAKVGLDGMVSSGSFYYLFKALLQTLAFLGLAGPLACLISATTGSALLALTHVIPFKALPLTWFSWYVGDTLGVLVVTPLILAWLGHPHPGWRPRRLQTTLPLLVGLMLASGVYLVSQRQEEIRIRGAFDRKAQDAAQLLPGGLRVSVRGQSQGVRL